MKSKGFTLIELVVVIVILGILAATVAPKFINLQAEARTSTLEGIKASMESAGAMVYGKSIVAGNQNLSETNTPAPTITLNDETELGLNYGYPRVNIIDWGNLLDLNDDFLIITNDDTQLVILPFPKTLEELTQTDCRVLYSPANLNNKPTIEVIPCV